MEFCENQISTQNFADSSPAGRIKINQSGRNANLWCWNPIVLEVILKLNVDSTHTIKIL